MLEEKELISKLISLMYEEEKILEKILEIEKQKTNLLMERNFKNLENLLLEQEKLSYELEKIENLKRELIGDQKITDIEKKITDYETYNLVKELRMKLLSIIFEIRFYSLQNIAILESARDVAVEILKGLEKEGVVRSKGFRINQYI